jgi:hypothetical protein
VTLRNAHEAFERVILDGATSGVSPNALNVIRAVWDKRKSDFELPVMKQHSAFLIDSNLKAMTTVGSPDPDLINRSFLRLRLNCSQQDGDNNEVGDKPVNYTMELSVDQLDSFILQLEDCLSSLNNDSEQPTRPDG